MTYRIKEPTSPKKRRTRWHIYVGKSFELLLNSRNLDILTEIQISSTPPLIDILILRRHSEAWTPDQLQFLPSGIRQSKASHILIEFKMRETFGERVVRQAIGYDYFYQDNQELSDEDVETFIMCAQTPQEATLAASGYQPTDQPGIYRHGGLAVSRITLIVINELEPVLHNAFVQCFATHRKVRVNAFQQIKAMERENLAEAFWHFVSGLQQLWREKEEKAKTMITDELMIDEEMTPETLIDMGREWEEFFINRMTAEQHLARVSTGDILHLLNRNDEMRKDVVAHLPSEDILYVLDQDEEMRKDVAAHLPPEDILHVLDQDEEMRKQLLAHLPTEERLSGMKPEERLSGMKPEDRLVGIKPEEVPAMLEQLQRFLRQQLDKPAADSKA